MIILDESVAALDVSIQAQILNLLADIRARTGVSYILISHDLAVVRQITDEAIVMHRGRRSSSAGRPRRSSTHPQHEYTQLLRASVPRPGWKPQRRRRPDDDEELPHDRSRPGGRARPHARPRAPVGDRGRDHGGTIDAVGSDAEIRELCGSATEVIDLHGAAVVPGITDSHLHPFLGAVGARGADLTGRDLARRRSAAGSREERARCAPPSGCSGSGSTTTRSPNPASAAR